MKGMGQAYPLPGAFRKSSRCKTGGRFLILGLAITFFGFWGTASWAENGGKAAPWPASLYCSGGGWWRFRIPVTIRNRGPNRVEDFPIVVPCDIFQQVPSGVPIRVEELRVCDTNGVELLFAVREPSGKLVVAGPIPREGWLVLPAVCEPQSETTVHVYCGNLQAWPVPDFYQRYPSIINGDLELGQDGVPVGWRHDPNSSEYRTFWTDEVAKSGRRSLKTVVTRGSEPSWIATRQSGIAVIGGARYRMRGWVRAENVEGFAGWYVHVGTAENPMMIAPMLSAGGGSYEWKQVEAEFVAPPGATTASVGTVLRGTGMAWFDQLELECLDSGPLEFHLGGWEELSLEDVGGPDATWPDEPGRQVASQQGAAGSARWLARAHLQVIHPQPERKESVLVMVDSARLRPYFAKGLGAENFWLSVEGRARSFFLGENLLFESSLPAKSIIHAYLYFARGKVQEAGQNTFPRFVMSPFNRVKNPSFELGGDFPEGWEPSGLEPGVANVQRCKLEDDTLGLGQWQARLESHDDTPSRWRGFRQRVPVEGGKEYLVAGYLKTKNVKGQVRIHIHRRKKDGNLAGPGAMTSVGPSLSGTQGWTLLSGIIPTNAETAYVEIHLTANCPGIVHYDGIFVGEVVRGELLRLELPPDKQSEELQVWPVSPLVKVFPDTIPNCEEGIPSAVEIAAGRNEWEAVQVAVRSVTKAANVVVEVEPPRHPSGAVLDQFDVLVCGLVPVDYPTNYYRDDRPAWQRRIPAGTPNSDGWSGWWPDPLIPADRVQVPRGETRSLWVLFRIPANAPAGHYHGRVKFRREGERNAGKTLELIVRVWDFALPTSSRFIALYDVRYGPGGQWWGRSFDQMYPRIVEFLARRRLCPDMVRPAPRFRWANGHWEVDFSEFDRAAEWYFDQLGLPVSYMPQEFYLFGWGLPPKRVAGIAPYPSQPPYSEVDRGQLSPEYKQAYQSLLRAFWDHVRKRGWHDRFVLYLSDEPFAHEESILKQFRALCRMIHEVDPSIPIYSSTWRLVDQWVDDLDIWGIGHYGVVAPEKMKELQERGKRIWFTTDGQMCLDTPYCAIERLLPYYCYKYGAEGYEFWGVSWFTHDPHRFGWHSFIYQTDRPGHSYYVRYPNGDGYLVYPGKELREGQIISSIRLEQAREGVEDYEYLRLAEKLEAEALRAGVGKDSLVKLQACLKRLTDLVSIPAPEGRYSSRILPEPEVLEAARVSLGDTIEDLKNLLERSQR